MLKWLKRIGASLILLVVLVVGGVYLASILRLNRTYDTAAGGVRRGFVPRTTCRGGAAHQGFDVCGVP